MVILEPTTLNYLRVNDLLGQKYEILTCVTWRISLTSPTWGCNQFFRPTRDKTSQTRSIWYDMIWYDTTHLYPVFFFIWPTNMGVQGPNINDMYIYIYTYFFLHYSMYIYIQYALISYNLTHQRWCHKLAEVAQALRTRHVSCWSTDRWVGEPNEINEAVGTRRLL